MTPILLLILTLGQIALCDHEISGSAPSEWILYKNLFNKTYDNIVEEQFRIMIFMENKEMVTEHNILYAQNLTTYEMAVNHLSDMLPYEIVSTMQGLQLGLDSSTEDNKTSTFIPPDEDVSIPESVDWRTKGVVTPVKSQGSCGSCWAFSATGALEGQHARATGKLVSLSEQDLVDCCKSCKGCKGGIMNRAFKCIKHDQGIDSEENYSYKAKNGECRYNASEAVADDLGYVVIKRGSEIDLQKAVALIGPVSVGISVSKNFYKYKSGVFYDELCISKHINHGVLVVGYGTENGTDYWLVKNSWGRRWGDHGYIKMARNKDNNCGIAKMASYPLV